IVNQRQLLTTWPVSHDLPIMIVRQLTNTETSFISVALATASWMACRGGSVVGVEVRCEIPEGAHRNFPDLPADLSGYVEDQKTVDARLIATGIARIMDIKRVAVAGVVVQGWRKLEVRDVREVKFRANLPAEHECIGKRGLLSLTAYWLRRCRGRPNWV